MQSSSQKQLLTLWIGPYSQQQNFSFHNLQSQQIFSQQQDPISQSCLWKDFTYAKNDNPQPRSILFDFQIERLSAVREINNKKMLKKMKNQQNWGVMSLFGRVQTSGMDFYGRDGRDEGKGKEEQDENRWIQMANWDDKESNYVLLDKNYTSIPTAVSSSFNNSSIPFSNPIISNPSQNSGNKSIYNPDLQHKKFSTFQQFYRINRQNSQNRLRKQLQQMDYLKVFAICSDENYSGFTSQMVQHLRQQCPKQIFSLSTLTRVQPSPVPILPLSHLYPQVDIFIPITQSLLNPFFTSPSSSLGYPLSQSFAPLFSTLLTPFLLKQVEPYHYMSQIVQDGRKIFNCAHTLPVIKENGEMDLRTDLARYEQSMWRERKKRQNGQGKKSQEFTTYNQKYKKQTNQKPPISKQQKQLLQQQIHLNFTNSSYLSLYPPSSSPSCPIPFPSPTKISQSFIFKGHFSNFQSLMTPYLSSPSSLLSIKYTPGIFSAPPSYPLNGIQYTEFYHEFYGKQPQAYPYCGVLFSDGVFGKGIRAGLGGYGKEKGIGKGKVKGKIWDQNWEETREIVELIADRYMQESGDEQNS